MKLTITKASGKELVAMGNEYPVGTITTSSP